jgi:arginase family enzyme
VIDYGDVEWTDTNLDTRVTEDIYQVFKQLATQGVSTLSCGGEHTTTFGVLQGLSEGLEDAAFGLIHIDDHCDTMAMWGSDVINDGCLFRQAALNGYVDPERTVQIGIRGRANFLWEFSHDTGMTVISADEVFDKGTRYVIDKAVEIVGKDKTYLSLDVDGLDSTYMMGTTNPEPFGLLPRQVRDIIHGVYNADIIGADIVELNPNNDPGGYSAHIAAGLFFELLCLLANAGERRTGKCNPTTWA